MSTLIDGRKVVTTAGTRVQLANQTAGVLGSVALQAETDNTGVVVVGAATVVAAQATRTGIALAAGQSVSIDCDDLADIWLDSTVSGDGVSYVATVR